MTGPTVLCELYKTKRNYIVATSGLRGSEVRKYFINRI